MLKKWITIFDKFFVGYLIGGLLIIGFEYYAFKCKDITIEKRTIITFLIWNILYFLVELSSPLIRISKINDIMIKNLILELEIKSRFLRTQNNDLITNNITPIVTIVIGMIAYNNFQNGFLAILIASLTLLSCMVASLEIYFRIMTNRLIEQIRFKEPVMGEVNIQEQEFLIKLICAKFSRKTNVSGRLLILNLLVIISTFYGLLLTTLKLKS